MTLATVELRDENALDQTRSERKTTRNEQENSKHKLEVITHAFMLNTVNSRETLLMGNASFYETFRMIQ